MNPMSRLAENGKNPRWPSADILKKQYFLTSPMSKCDMSFLTHFGAWNPFLGLRLQVYAYVTFKHHIKVKT